MLSLASTITDIVLPRCDEVYMLTGAERWHITSIARGFLQQKKVLVEYRRWLCKQESGRGFFLPGILIIYREYHASKLQRCYLRRLCTLSHPCVVAGSFPSAMYLNQTSSCGWSPNDIDIFVGDKTTYGYLLGLYREMVVNPLQLQERSTYWSQSNDINENCEYPNLVQSPRRWNALDRDHRALPLRERIGYWLQEALDREIITYALYESMTRIYEFLPALFIPQTYSVCATLQILCLRGRSDVPKSLVPVNIILVNLPTRIDCASAAASFICNGFDITACCVALQVNEDLSFTFQEYNNAFDALRNNKLILRPSAFCGGARNVPAQMRRLSKYLQRGLRWPS